MSVRRVVRWVGALLVAALVATAAPGYIHFAPMSLPKMCKASYVIRAVTVKALDAERGVVVFELAELLKGKRPMTSLKHVARGDAVKPFLDWAVEGKRAVLFSIEGDGFRTPGACGYLFVDRACYSLDYKMAGEFWFVMRPEPNLAACFHGPAEQLEKLTKDYLAGEVVVVPTKELEASETEKHRIDAVTEKLIENRKK